MTVFDITDINNIGSSSIDEIFILGNPFAIVIDPAGEFAYVTSLHTNLVSKIDLYSNEIVGTIVVGSRPYSIAITPDGTFLYVTANMDDTVFVINADLIEFAEIPVVREPIGVTIYNDGDNDLAIILSTVFPQLSVINTESLQLMEPINIYPGGTYIAIFSSSSIDYGYITYNTGHVYVYDLTNKQYITSIEVGEAPNSIAITPL